MGSYGSGPTVEDSLTLNLPRLFKTGWLKPGARTSGTLRWSVVGTGEETASMGFEACLGAEQAYIRLDWTSTNRWSGETRQCENRIGLTTTTQPCGAAMVVRVPSHRLARHAAAFASGGPTPSRELPRDRALSRALALRRKLGATGGTGDYIAKPKGMHWRTFERAMARIRREPPRSR